MPRIFISHASEDKKDFARPLAAALLRRGYNVWFDEFTLTLGDSLREEIERGLSLADYAVVILSPAFFSKQWTRAELDALWTLELAHRRKVILPILHNVTLADVVSRSPMLAGKLAASSDRGLDNLVQQITEAVERSGASVGVNATANPRAGSSDVAYPRRAATQAWPTMVAGCAAVSRFYALALMASLVIFLAYGLCAVLIGYAGTMDVIIYVFSPPRSERVVGYLGGPALTFAVIIITAAVLRRRGMFAALYAVVACTAGAIATLTAVSVVVNPKHPLHAYASVAALALLCAVIIALFIVAAIQFLIREARR